MLYYSEEQWKKINREKSPEEIKDIMSSAIVRGKIPFPYEQISQKEAREDFMRLKETRPLAALKKGSWGSKFQYTRMKQIPAYLVKDNLGKKTSNKYTQKSRLAVDHRQLMSMVRAWDSPESHHSMLSGIWTIFNSKSITPDSMRRAIQLRKYCAAQFRPSAARAIYELYGGGDVLDFSAGWGDRLVGALASPSVKSYTGVDPNPKLHPCYRQIQKTVGTLAANPKIQINLIKDKAENVDYGDKKFDIVFTSPPYFDVERYEGNESSWRNFKSQNDWINGFLCKAMSNGYRHLKNGGYMLINISDMFIRAKRISICKPMVDFMEKSVGAKYLGNMGYQLSKTVGQHVDRPEGVYCEPIFVFCKL